MKRFFLLPCLWSILLLTAGFSSQSLAQTQPIKLFRFGSLENEKAGVIAVDGKRYDVSAFGEDYNEAFFSKNGIVRLQDWFEKNRSNCPEVPDKVRIASCIARPSKIVAIGLNYLEHVREGG